MELSYTVILLLPNIVQTSLGEYYRTGGFLKSRIDRNGGWDKSGVPVRYPTLFDTDCDYMYRDGSPVHGTDGLTSPLKDDNLS